MGIKTTEERFWEKVKYPRSGCWAWQGFCAKDGYGRVRFGGVSFLAHRVSYAWYHGDLPPELDHMCRNRRCVNPGHLESVTHKENCRRGEGGSNNAKKTHCLQGHEYTEENTYRFPQGNRYCRQCRSAARTRWVERQL